MICLGMNENSKQKILKVATHLFAQKGFDAVSVREVCKQADVNVCMISYYFGGKQELYRAIIDELIAKQTEYAKKSFDLTLNLRKLTKQEQINLLGQVLDKFIDFFYADISKDLILLLLKEQQNPRFVWKSPVFDYFKRLVAAVFDMEENSREAVYQMLFIIVQINCLLLGQEKIEQEDIDMIKSNIKIYINLMLREKTIGGYMK